MRILALEPYYGGSHKAFLDGWQGHSRHQWDLMTLPAYKWKWRMRHAPITFAEQLAQPLTNHGQAKWDVLFCSDMLNLAEFLGLVPAKVRDLPRVAMFHENQLTYPTQQSPTQQSPTRQNPTWQNQERDLHYGFSNITTALAADQVWFNSRFHRHEFLTAAKQLARRMPDFQPVQAIDDIARKATVQPLGIHPLKKPSTHEADQVLDILWAARWEHDKDPETFFDAIRLFRQSRCPFRLHLLGQAFRDVPDVFAVAKREFAEQIAHWGYAESRADYVRVLGKADVIVSTARHEFFGLSVLEAMSAGAVPLLPDRLSYPELLEGFPDLEKCLYKGGAEEIARRLVHCQRILRSAGWLAQIEQSQAAANRFAWSSVAKVLDARIDQAASG